MTPARPRAYAREMDDRSSLSVTVSQLLELTVGSYVELEGVLRTVSPLVGPISGRAVVGYHVVCSVFGAGDDYVGKHDVARWSEAILDDGTAEITIALEGSQVRAPAIVERTIEGDHVAPMLTKLGLKLDGPIRELQVIERGIADGARVAVRGQLARIDATGAFRTSARPTLGLRGDRGAPIVLTPR